ncbi:MAG: hypothetical protein WC527_05330 [Candidatus Margulisiibacteriota bacterium]
MKRNLLVPAFAISMIALATSCVAAALKTLPIELGKAKIVAYDKSTGNARWQSNLSTIKTSFSGKPYYYTEENGKGNFGSNNAYKTWKTMGYYQIIAGETVPYEVKQTMKDVSGNTVTTLDKSYNLKEGKIICSINNSTKMFDFNKNTIDKDLIGKVLANFPFEAGTDVNFYLLTHEPSLYNITMKSRGQETITINGKSVDCYKIEMIPDLGALSLLGAFVPKTYFWYTVSAPHKFRRYEGLESGLGTPVIVMESAD